MTRVSASDGENASTGVGADHDSSDEGIDDRGNVVPVRSGRMVHRRSGKDLTSAISRKDKRSKRQARQEGSVSFDMELDGTLDPQSLERSLRRESENRHRRGLEDEQGRRVAAAREQSDSGNSSGVEGGNTLTRRSRQARGGEGGQHHHPSSSSQPPKKKKLVDVAAPEGVNAAPSGIGTGIGGLWGVKAAAADSIGAPPPALVNSLQINDALSAHSDD